MLVPVRAECSGTELDTQQRAGKGRSYRRVLLTRVSEQHTSNGIEAQMLQYRLWVCWGIVKLKRAWKAAGMISGIWRERENFNVQSCSAQHSFNIVTQTIAKKLKTFLITIRRESSLNHDD